MSLPCYSWRRPFVPHSVNFGSNSPGSQAFKPQSLNIWKYIFKIIMMFYRHFHHLLRISGAKYLNHEVVVHLEKSDSPCSSLLYQKPAAWGAPQPSLLLPANRGALRFLPLASLDFSRLAFADQLYISGLKRCTLLHDRSRALSDYIREIQNVIELIAVKVGRILQAASCFCDR